MYHLLSNLNIFYIITLFIKKDAHNKFRNSAYCYSFCMFKQLYPFEKWNEPWTLTLLYVEVYFNTTGHRWQYTPIYINSRINILFKGVHGFAVLEYIYRVIGSYNEDWCVLILNIIHVYYTFVLIYVLYLYKM